MDVANGCYVAFVHTTFLFGHGCVNHRVEPL